MSYLKNYRKLMLFLVAVSLILVPGFTNDADAGKKKHHRCVSTDPVMISLSDLNDWINTGLALEAAGKDFSKGYNNNNNNGVKDSCGYKKMAILSVQSASDYAAGHPTGAYLWDQDTELRTDRSDGIIQSKSDHATAAMTDVILQRADINKKRVIVLTGNDLRQIGIAYSQLRYWGFPKAQLRVANGLVKDYISNGYTWDTNPVPDAGNDYNSVCDQDKNFKIDETRATVAEMMSVSQDSLADTVVLDVRTLGEFNGTANKKTAFIGRIKTAVWNEWKNETTTGSATAAGSQIKDAATLAAMYDLVDPNIRTGTSYIYCQTATRTGVSFLALDAMLGWKVKVYDGSWIEWGNLSDEIGDGTLVPGSPWALNNAAYTEALNEATVNTTKVVTGCELDPLTDAPNHTNENDKQVCGDDDDVVYNQTFDCNGNIN